MLFPIFSVGSLTGTFLVLPIFGPFGKVVHHGSLRRQIRRLRYVDLFVFVCVFFAWTIENNFLSDSLLTTQICTVIVAPAAGDRNIAL
jgi:hypothetical protein